MYPQAPGIRLVMIVAMLIYLFLVHRVLNRMRIGAVESFFLLMAMLAGGFLPAIPIWRGLALNIGGMLIPLAISVYLIVTADDHREKIRAPLVALLTGAVVWGLDRVLPSNPPGAFGYEFDPLYIPAVFAGIIAYILGRSRRSSFIGGVGAIFVLDLLAWGENMIRSTYIVPITLGGAGIFDAALIAGVFAVLLAEIIGEIRERAEREKL
ncbi:MAG: DUF1614 domain-containing protein [Dethiobacteria bacterium]